MEVLPGRTAPGLSFCPSRNGERVRGKGTTPGTKALAGASEDTATAQCHTQSTPRQGPPPVGQLLPALTPLSTPSPPQDIYESFDTRQRRASSPGYIDSPTYSRQGMSPTIPRSPHHFYRSGEHLGCKLSRQAERGSQKYLWACCGSSAGEQQEAWGGPGWEQCPAPLILWLSTLWSSRRGRGEFGARAGRGGGQVTSSSGEDPSAALVALAGCWNLWY